MSNRPCLAHACQGKVHIRMKWKCGWVDADGWMDKASGWGGCAWCAGGEDCGEEVMDA